MLAGCGSSSGGWPAIEVPRGLLKWSPYKISFTHKHAANYECPPEQVGIITIQNDSGEMFGGFLQLGALRGAGISLGVSQFTVAANESIDVTVTFECVRSGVISDRIKLQYWDENGKSQNIDFVEIDGYVP